MQGGTYTLNLQFRRRDKKPTSALFVGRTFDVHLFEAYLLTVCAYSKTKHEPQGGEHMSAELDEQYKRADGLELFRPRTSGITR